MELAFNIVAILCLIFGFIGLLSAGLGLIDSISPGKYYDLNFIICFVSLGLTGFFVIILGCLAIARLVIQSFT